HHAGRARVQPRGRRPARRARSAPARRRVGSGRPGLDDGPADPLTSRRLPMTEREALAVLRGDDPVGAARAATALWQMWHQSGQPRLDALLLQGVEAMQRQQLEEADGLFTRLIETAPQFAEGWNKRATVRYLAKNYVASIADCRETLVRNTLPTVPRMAPPGMSAVAMRSQVRATSAGPVPQPAFVQSISLGP